MRIPNLCAKMYIHLSLSTPEVLFQYINLVKWLEREEEFKAVHEIRELEKIKENLIGMQNLNFHYGKSIEFSIKYMLIVMK